MTKISQPVELLKKLILVLTVAMSAYHLYGAASALPELLNPPLHPSHLRPTPYFPYLSLYQGRKRGRPRDGAICSWP